MNEVATTIGELVGGLLTCIGVFMFSVPLGFVVAGALLITFSWLAAR